MVSCVGCTQMGASRVIAVFGRDSYGGQERRTFLCDNALTCQELAAAVERVLSQEDVYKVAWWVHKSLS